jgi:hypothetical protein
MRTGPLVPEKDAQTQGSQDVNEQQQIQHRYQTLQIHAGQEPAPAGRCRHD